MKSYDLYLDKLVHDSITIKSQINDLAFGLKEISGKLDTLIAIRQAELSRQPQQQVQQCKKEP